MNLGGEKSFAVARTLQRLLVPFVFATGYNAGDLPPEWQGVTRLEKPLHVPTIARALVGGTR